MSDTTRSEAILTATSRDGFVRSFVRLYGAGTIFRSCVDLTLIGGIVLLFLFPPQDPMSLLPDLFGSPSQDTASGTRPSSQNAWNSNATPTAQTTPVKSNGVKIERDWFTLSPAELVPDLEAAADSIENGKYDEAKAQLAAAEQREDLNAFYLLALLHRSKGGVAGFQLSAQYYERAARAGQPVAMFQHAKFLAITALNGSEGQANAYSWFKKAADAGVASASGIAGRYLIIGWGVPKDVEKGLRYLRIGAEGGDGLSQALLAAAYLTGLAVERDFGEALKWNRASAENGNNFGRYYLAMMHFAGSGTKVDYDAFLHWMKLAADDNFNEALFKVGQFLNAPPDGHSPDLQSAAGYFRRAALRRHGRAQTFYAAFLEHGRGIKKNLVQAYVYYVLAQDTLDADRQSNLLTFTTPAETKYYKGHAKRGQERIAKALTPAQLERANKLLGAQRR